MRRLIGSILCSGVAMLGTACATKSFVRQEVGTTERKLTEQMSATGTQQDTKLRETTDRVGENRQAIDAADQRLNGLDLRVGEASTRAGTAETHARDVEARLAQRLATRNRFRLVETKSVHFDADQTDVRSQDVDELASVAKVLVADPNAMLELQGFTDARGSDRYNRELARERVEAVMRHLVQQHGVELRQVRAIAMGKDALAAGEKPGPDALAKARRVDMRLFTPWSSWEDNQNPIESSAPDAPSTVTSMQPARGHLPEILNTITPNDLGGK